MNLDASLDVSSEVWLAPEYQVPQSHTVTHTPHHTHTHTPSLYFCGCFFCLISHYHPPCTSTWPQTRLADLLAGCDEDGHNNPDDNQDEDATPSHTAPAPAPLGGKSDAAMNAKQEPTSTTAHVTDFGVTDGKNKGGGVGLDSDEDEDEEDFVVIDMPDKPVYGQSRQQQQPQQPQQQGNKITAAAVAAGGGLYTGISYLGGSLSSFGGSLSKFDGREEVQLYRIVVDIAVGYNRSRSDNMIAAAAGAAATAARTQHMSYYESLHDMI